VVVLPGCGVGSGQHVVARCEQRRANAIPVTTTIITTTDADTNTQATDNGVFAAYSCPSMKTGW
jgi:hypothetical protein